MNEKVKLIVVAAVVLLAFAGAYFLYTNLSSRYAPEKLQEVQATENPQKEENTPVVTDEEDKDKAPDFSVIDADGNIIKLSDMRGKPVVLNFWATWCHYCKVEMPDFETMYQKYGSDVQFMMVDLADGYRETVDAAMQHVASNGFTFPVYYDTFSGAVKAYKISGIPATYFIDADGKLVAQTQGTIDAESLEKGINMIN